jgi:holo-[acyl-carrier protein] synthase
MIVGVGVDIVDIARFSRALNRTKGLAARLFTEGEQGLPVKSLAVRFAAKEALAKAIGGPSGMLWTDAEIVTGALGRPEVKVYGTVAAAAARLAVRHWHVSLSHDAGVAVAVVVAEGEPASAQAAQAAPGAQAAHGAHGLGWV